MVSTSNLLAMHGVAAIAHLVQSAYTVSLTNTVYKDKGLKVNLTNDNKTITDKFPLGNVVAIFPIMSTFNHTWSYFNQSKYLHYVEQGYNPVKWTEYSMSAGVMFYLIAQMSGISDIKPLAMLVGGNIALQYFGYKSERDIYKKVDIKDVENDNNVGFILFMSLWIPIFIAFFTTIDRSDGSTPDIIYSIIFVMFALFLVFGLVNLAYIRGVKNKSNNIKHLEMMDFKNVEMAYIVLSLVSKTLLTNMTLFGTSARDDQEPSSDDQEPSSDDQEPSSDDQEPSSDDQEPSSDDQEPSSDRPYI